jgi:hypothetical protein
VAAAALGFAGRTWAGAVTKGVARLVGDRFDARAAGRFVVAAALVSAIVTFAGASAMLVGAARASVDRPGSLSDRGLEVYTWIARAAPLDARILANGSTSGVIALLGRRTGIIDGPIVDERDRPVLARATGLALGARVVFADPDGDRAATYLAREGVTHLLVAGPAATAADLGARAVIPADAAAIDASHRFGLVRSFGDRVFLYEVLALP